MRFSTLAVQALSLLAWTTTLSYVGFGSASLFVVADETVESESAAKEYVPPDSAEKYGFQAEVHRMLDIVVNSLYQHKDVFLRELISNASDALDKIRYLMLTQPDQYKKSKEDEDLKLEVQIEYDSVANTITIRDTGVGMTHDEMVSNLGTVARSGTTKFMEALKESGNAEATMSQIGKFGVGFYSAFLVADRVTVASKSPLEPVQNIWESTNGASEFFIYPDPRGNSLVRGTEITLHLKDGETHYAEESKIKSMAKHFSEFIIHPISVRVTETMMVDDDDEDEDIVPQDEDDLEVKDDEDEDAIKDKPKKQKEVTTQSWELVNGNPALWTRDKDEITDEEYQHFYGILANDETQKAAEWSHFKAEGNINFQSILYLPEDLPPGYRTGGPLEAMKGSVRLYVRKVLIGDDFDLFPKYLGFLRGVVDSDELTLNVNRETLQEEKTLKVIRLKLVKKAIDLIRQFAKEGGDDDDASEEDQDETEGDDESKKEKVVNPKKGKYFEWYKKFSPNIKLGVIEDYKNREKLVKLLRFETSKSDGKMIPLDKYVKNMKDWQKEIYVLGCVNSKECQASPFLEAFHDKDVEVIFMTDAIDEYMLKQVHEFNKKRITQISSDNVKLGDEDDDMVKRREKVYREKFSPLTKYLKTLYEGTVMRVQVAKRNLGKNVPAITTSTQYGNSANMERIMKAQAYQYGVDPSQVNAMKVFEINPRHPIILQLLHGCPMDKEKKEIDAKAVPEDLVDAAWMIHDMAMLNGGFSVSDSEAHNKRMLKVLQKQFSLDSITLLPEIHPPVEDDVPPDMDDSDGMNMDDFDGPMMDMNNLNVDELRDRFPDAGWPDKGKDEL